MAVGLATLSENKETPGVWTQKGPRKDTAGKQTAASQWKKPWEKPIFLHFDLGLPVSRSVRKYISVV